MKEYHYEIVMYWDDIDNIFIAEVPELPGCMAHGSTKIDAIKNTEEAISVWLKTAIEDGIEVPHPKEHQMIA